MSDVLVLFAVGPDARSRAAAAASTLVRGGWTLRVNDDEWRVWTRDSSPVDIRVDPVDGLVVGEVFARPEAVAELAPEAWSAGILDEASIDRRAARWVRRCWGPHFVAWRRPDGAGVAIYREAGGGREALVWSLGGLTVITSGLDAPGLETLRPRLDVRVDRVAAFLGDPSEIGGDLALNAVTAIAPGRLWRAGGGSRTLWSPSAFAAAPFADGVDDLESETEFSTTIRRTLTAVADLDRPLLAEISGGLDSAMMAWGLSGRSQVRRWLHVHAGPLEADERRLARAVAERLGLALTRAPTALS